MSKIDETLKQIGKDKCPDCKQAISQGDISWNNPYGVIEISNGETEAGTPFCFIECLCPKCDSEVFSITSWYPSIDDLDDLLIVLEDRFLIKKI